MSVRQLRVVVTADDYEEALRFYRDVLGLPELGAFSGEHGHVSILDAGRATLELSDPAHADYIDEVEVGARVAGHIRIAFEIEDADEATTRLAARRDRPGRADADAVGLPQQPARGACRPPADALRGAAGRLPEADHRLTSHES